MLTHPSGLFGILKFGPNGVLVPQIVTRARFNIRLLMHTSNWNGVSQKILRAKIKNLA